MKKSDVATLYEQIKAISDTIALPRHYRDDLLVHDQAVLANRGSWKLEPGDRLIWVARECGTHLIGLEGDADLLAYFDTVMSEPGRRCYLLTVETVGETGATHGTVRPIKADRVRDLYREATRNKREQRADVPGWGPMLIRVC